MDYWTGLILTVPMKVKKTDLPVLPQDTDMLPPLDDGSDGVSDNNSEDDEDDDDIDDEEDEEMLGDEPIESDDDEYDSDEEFDSGSDKPSGADAIDTGSAAWDSFTTPPPAPAVGKDGLKKQPTDMGGPIGGMLYAGGYAASSTEKSGSIELVTTPITAIPTPDPYFTHFDPRNEHQSFKNLHAEFQEAQQRLEESHREKVTRVMKDWSDLEEKYQDMRLADPKSAQTFKQRMTARFQTSVQALEEEGNSEKHQLAAMHQQRVLAHINQRKREAMTCYTQALTEQPPSKLLRALHKDRAHALSHYRHLLGSGGTGGLEAAASERPRTLERLVDIDRAVNQSMAMLKRYPELSVKLSQLMDDYIQALRSKDETPGSMLAMTEEAEAAILDKYRMEIERKVSEKERQRSPQPTALPTVDDEAVQRAVEEVAAAVAHQEAEPKMQHVLAHDIGHGEPVSEVVEVANFRLQ
uniref:E2 domain-containing protein n=1 Tax=Anopheles culicifacies TaxID=139723 RepID=A0A182MRY3_9DIPT